MRAPFSRSPHRGLYPTGGPSNLGRRARRELALEGVALYEKESGDCGGRIISPGMSDEEPDAGGNT